MLPHRLVSGCGLIQVRIPTDPRAKGWGGRGQGDRRRGSLPVDRATFFPEDHRIYLRGTTVTFPISPWTPWQSQMPLVNINRWDWSKVEPREERF